MTQLQRQLDGKGGDSAADQEQLIEQLNEKTARVLELEERVKEAEAATEEATSMREENAATVEQLKEFLMLHIHI